MGLEDEDFKKHRGNPIILMKNKNLEYKYKLVKMRFLSSQRVKKLDDNLSRLMKRFMRSLKTHKRRSKKIYNSKLTIKKI